MGKTWPGCAVLAAAIFGALPAPAKAADVSCRMDFQVSGWSVFYQTASGSGTVHCDNGQSMAVRIRVKGGGLTFGKTRITHGVGSSPGSAASARSRGITPTPRSMPARRSPPRRRC